MLQAIVFRFVILILCFLCVVKNIVFLDVNLTIKIYTLLFSFLKYFTIKYPFTFIPILIRHYLYHKWVPLSPVLYLLNTHNIIDFICNLRFHFGEYKHVIISIFSTDVCLTITFYKYFGFLLNNT